jgi:hypothetical protein
MPYPLFDRKKLDIKSLSARKNKVRIEQDYVPVNQKPTDETGHFKSIITETVERIKVARKKNAPVMLTFGAHTIKNGLGPLMIKLMEDGWITHLATNGAGIIHDWEFAFQGQSSEDVRANVDQGQFGIWEETGKYINLALLVGAYEGKGYGEAVGSMIQNEGVEIPSESELEKVIANFKGKSFEKAATAIDFLNSIKNFGLETGWQIIPFPYKQEEQH